MQPERLRDVELPVMGVAVICILTASIGITGMWLMLAPLVAILACSAVVRALLRGTVPRERVNERAVDWYVHRKLPAFPPKVSAQQGSDTYDPFCHQTVDGFRHPNTAAQYIAQYLSGEIEVEQLDKRLDYYTLADDTTQARTIARWKEMHDGPQGGYAIIPQTSAEREARYREKYGPSWRDERDAHLAAGHVWDRALGKFVPHPGTPASVTRSTPDWPTTGYDEVIKSI